MKRIGIICTLTLLLVAVFLVPSPVRDSVSTLLSDYVDGSKPSDTRTYGVDPKSLPKIVTDADLKPKDDLQAIYGLQGKDVSSKDFSNVSLETLANLSFDSNTVWPDDSSLPGDFRPSDWIVKCMDPGLRVRELHERGITGKGVNVAVIDKPITKEHAEFADRIRLHTIGSDKRLYFHGLGCASILSGKECGVAPESVIHYYATPNVGRNFHYYALALGEIVESNDRLPLKDRIRVVSISDGAGEGDPSWKEWNRIYARASTKGIIIIYSNRAEDSGFLWGGCPPLKDRDNPFDYSKSHYLAGQEIECTEVLLPGDYRTTASNNGHNVYTYYGQGGFSLALPYLAGLCALGLQVNPNLTYDEMVKAIKATADTSGDGLRIVNPARFIDAVVKG